MTDDITPWLNEIKTLQQKIIELQTELNTAQDSVSKWRKLYNTEAQQRRDETQLAQEIIETLKTQVQKLQDFPYTEGDKDESATTIEHQIEHLRTLDEFQAKIIEVSQERDRALQQVQNLTEALKQEQANHANTRRSLTNALADAVDLFAKAKATKSEKSETTPDSQNQIPIQLQDHPSSYTVKLLTSEKLLPSLPSSKEKDLS